MAGLGMNKRRILVIEDNELNTEILSAILEDEFDVLTAMNGEEGFKMLSKHFRELSLVLLDVYMPVCTGFEFLEKVKADPILAGIPIIVTTGSENPEDEVKCLKLGASDFVTKPYNPEVVLGRAHSIIKLRESVATLSVVEYDSLTGLYTMSAFQHHAQGLLAADDEPCHLMVLNLQEFKLVNSVFGEKQGDEVLIFIANAFKKYMENGIIARQGDKFFALFKMRNIDRWDRREEIYEDVVKNAPIPNLILKVGCYLDVDKRVPITLLCDRVIMAAASIRKDFSQTFAFYDKKIESELIASQKMEADFDAAIEKEQFVVWYQPKVETATEMITGAEALVRWIDESGNMISPGTFIPLFERDALIGRLDEYVFRKVCQFQKTRIEEKKPMVPVSVNLSRNSFHQCGTVGRYAKIIEEAGIPKSVVPIELTESAATEGNEIRGLAEQFSTAGFSLHMDDFGTGYSSFSSLTIMPFEVIKLDKSLIDGIGSNKGNTVVRHMIDIAQEMGMRVVAEGVEKSAQVDFLRNAGCDAIQGYYYSLPVKQQLFEEMLDNGRKTMRLDIEAEYQKIVKNIRAEYELDDCDMAVMRRFAEDMMEGFFVYRATGDETILYANQSMIELFGCNDIQDFRKITGNSFRGIVCAEEYERVEHSIFEQISGNEEFSDEVDYHIVRKDGMKVHVKDRGRCVHTETYGNLFYVFVEEMCAAK